MVALRYAGKIYLVQPTYSYDSMRSEIRLTSPPNNVLHIVVEEHTGPKYRPLHAHVDLMLCMGTTTRRDSPATISTQHPAASRPRIRSYRGHAAILESNQNDPAFFGHDTARIFPRKQRVRHLHSTCSFDYPLSKSEH